MSEDSLSDSCDTIHNNAYFQYYKLIALVNCNSGAKKGWNLAKALKKYDVSVYNVKDLSVNELIRETLSIELYEYRNNCVVLICGGDGTNIWATSLIDESIKNYSISSKLIPYPPIVTVPMGTGNDLSRVLGWGNVQANNNHIMNCIADILFAAQIAQRWNRLDRWGITYTFEDTQINKSKFNQPLPSTFLCYLSIGYDAFITHQFEQERRNKPNKFKHQRKNQTVYIKHGLKQLFKPCEPITDLMDVIIDNKLTILPNNCRSLKLININSAANGVFFWGSDQSKKNEYQQKYKPRLDDGILEVMCTTGVSNMLQCKTNMSHAQRISQTNDITIKFKKIPPMGIALQIDGEAFIIKQKCSIHITLYDQLKTVIGYNKPRGVSSKISKNSVKKYKYVMKAKKIFRKSMKTILNST